LQEAENKQLAKQADEEIECVGDLDYGELRGVLTPDSMKPKFTLPRLHDAGGNPQKEWYVDFYFRDHIGVNRRIKRVEGFYKCKTLDAKRAHGLKLCKKYEALLNSGWDPFNPEPVLVDDHLQYASMRNEKHAPDYNIKYWINTFLATKKLTLRDKTISTYTSKLRKFIGWIETRNLQDIHISLFDKDHVRKFSYDLQAGFVTDAKLSNKSVNAYIQILETCWSWVMENTSEYLKVNPWMRLKPLKETVGRRVTYSAEQRERMFKFLEKEDKHLWMVCRLIYQTFIRPGREISGLKIGDIDFVENKIWIPAEIAKNKKTDWVPLPSDVMEKLIEIEADQLPKEYYVFSHSGPGKNKVCRDFWSKRFRKKLVPHIIPAGMTIYALKHTGNQVAHLNGMPLKQQKELNRHHSLDQMDAYLQGMRRSNTMELNKYIPD
jgi:integrase